MGSGKYDYGNSIFADSLGNVYTTGSIEQDLLTDSDIFISKLDSNGNFVWTKVISGTSGLDGRSIDEGRGIFLDSSDNIYTTGDFQGTVDFDPGPGTFFLTSEGDNDIFISKMDSNGNFVWTKAIGGTSGDRGTSIFVDSSDNVYTTGDFSDTVNFDPGTGTFNMISAGNYDIFINKLDSNGNFIWAKAIGGTSEDRGTKIFLDSSDNVYTTGYFQGAVDFDPGTGTFFLTSAGSYGCDIFISKLDSNGNFVWTKAIGADGWDQGWSIFVDSSDNVYTTGYFSGTVDFDPGPGTINITSGTICDIFISKLDSNGNFLWAKTMGASGFDEGSDIFIDSSGNIYTIGQFQKVVDFDPGPGKFNLTSSYARDIFISKLSGPVTFLWPVFLPAMTNNAQPLNKSGTDHD